MCDEKIAVVGRAAGRRAQQKHDAQVAADAVRSYVNGAAPKKERGPLAVTLCVVAGIVLLASMNAILHALLIAVISVLGVAALGAGVLLFRRVRALSQPQIAPWLPQAPARTTVTGVRVRAIEGSALGADGERDPVAGGSFAGDRLTGSSAAGSITARTGRGARNR